MTHSPPPRRDLQLALSVAILCAGTTGFVVGAQTAEPIHLGPYGAYDTALQLCQEQGYSVWTPDNLALCGPWQFENEATRPVGTRPVLLPDEMNTPAPAGAEWSDTP